MSIQISPYDTTALAYVVQSKIVTELRKAYRMDGLHILEYEPTQLSSSMRIALVEGGNMHSDVVPIFKHPIFFKEEGHQVLALDIRSYGSVDALSGEFRTNNAAGLAWDLRRAILTQLWDTCRVEIFKTMAKFPMTAYATVLGQSLQRRYALNPAEQMKIMILCAFHFMCLFSDERELDEVEKIRIIGTIMETTRAPEAMISNTLQGVGHIANISELAELIKNKLDNQALRDFNLAMLLQSVTMMGRGRDDSEVIAVGLEHIPTWYLITDSSMNSLYHRRTTLAKVIQSMKSAKDSSRLHDALNQLVGPPECLTHRVMGSRKVYDDHRSQL